MNDIIENFFKWAINNNWIVRRRDKSELELPDEINRRYPRISQEYLSFLKQIEKCISPDEKDWFLCQDDFKGYSDSAFKWNEIEELCISEAVGDDKWQREITSFWDDHLPINLSVNRGYAFYAINVKNEFGKIAYGIEPEFEEISYVSDTFFELLNEIILGNIKL